MMADGKGCKCAAKSAVDCCCTGVDWRSKREVELEAEIIKEKIDHQQTTVHLSKALSEVERLQKGFDGYEGMGSTECPQCDRAKDARYRAELDRYDAIADLKYCIDTMENVSFVHRGDALRVQTLLNQLCEKYHLCFDSGSMEGE